MSVTIQGNTSTVISNNSAPEGTSEIAKITRQIQVLTEKLGKISSEEGMTTQQKKEMAALVQKQIESLRAQLEQLLRQQAEKKNKDATVQPDKKEEKKDDTNTAGTGFAPGIGIKGNKRSHKQNKCQFFHITSMVYRILCSI